MTATKAYSDKDMNGLKVKNLGAPDPGSNDAVREVDLETGIATAESRANHTGTQLASTISDFDAQVRTSRLDQMAAPTGDVSLNSHQLTDVLDPDSAQDAATKNYVDTQVAGVVSGAVQKGAVKVATTGNVNLAAPGANLDGVAMGAGELFLATGQTTGTENGSYVYNGAATPATRASNWDTDAEATLGSFWIVEQGTKGDQFALLTNDTAITLGTSVPAFTFISVSGAGIGRYSVTCPAVTAGATWTVTHNMNSRDVHIRVRRTASPYDFVDVYTEATTNDTCSVIPDLAMASGEFTAIVKY